VDQQIESKIKPFQDLLIKSDNFQATFHRIKVIWLVFLLLVQLPFWQKDTFCFIL